MPDRWLQINRREHRQTENFRKLEPVAITGMQQPRCSKSTKRNYHRRYSNPDSQDQLLEGRQGQEKDRQAVEQMNLPLPVQTIALLLVAIISTASPLQAARYVNQQAGFAIELPSGFRFDAEEDDMLYFNSTQSSGVLIVHSWPGLGSDEIQSAMQGGFHEEGINLTPVAAPDRIQIENGRGMAVKVKGVFLGHPVRGLLAGGSGDQGQGLVILAGALPDDWKGFRKLARKLVNSFAMIPIVEPPEVSKWKRWLSGRRLAKRSTYGDYSAGGTSSEDIYLCSDGSFLESSSLSESWGGNAGFGSGQGSSRGAGSWDVRPQDGNIRIIFSYHDGSQSWARLDEKDGNTRLNGSTYFVVENDQCQ